MNKSGKIQTLFVFNHTGKEIPWQYKDYFVTEDEDRLRKVIDANHDFGTEVVMERLKSIAEENPELGWKVMFFPVSRVFADSNRLERHEQIVDQPYRGEGVWNQDVDKDKVGAELIDPFMAEFERTLQENPIKFIFYIHSMDEFGGGQASGSHEVAQKGARRPESMIFNKYAFKTRPYGMYGPEGEDGEVDFNLLTENQIRTIERIHANHLRKIPGLETEHIDIPIDYPYISPRQVCGLASRYFDGPQLVIDIRKDLFVDGAECIANSVVEIAHVITKQRTEPKLQVDESLHQLVDLAAINSHSLNKQGVNKKARFIREELFAEINLDWEEYPEETYGSLLVGRTEVDASLPMIGLMVHMDTVHQPETEMPIYEIDGKLYGPGMQDIQASIFVIKETMLKLQAEGKLQNLVLVINSAEERGSPVFAEEFKQIAASLDYLMVYESAGNGDLDPADSKFHKNFSLIVERKGIFAQGIKTIGPGGHSGVLGKKEDRLNAISQAIQMMAAIDNLADYEKETTVNMEYVNGGQINTIIAQNCEFYFDTRFRFEEERQRLKDAISNIMGTEYVDGVQVQDLGYIYDLPSLPPNSRTEEFFALVQEAAPDFKIQSERRGGWSDGCNMYAFNPKLKVLDGFGPKGGGEHTRDEFVYIESIWASVELSRQVIQHLLTRRN